MLEWIRYQLRRLIHRFEIDAPTYKGRGEGRYLVWSRREHCFKILTAIDECVGMVVDVGHAYRPYAGMMHCYWLWRIGPAKTPTGGPRTSVL